MYKLPSLVAVVLGCLTLVTEQSGRTSIWYLLLNHRLRLLGKTNAPSSPHCPLPKPYASHMNHHIGSRPINTLWLIGERGDPKPVPDSLLSIEDVVVGDGHVCRNAVVPECDSAWFPADANLEVLALCYVLSISNPQVSIFYKTPLSTCTEALTLNSSFSNSSDSSSLRLMIFLVKSGLMKSAFSPVA